MKGLEALELCAVSLSHGERIGASARPRKVGPGRDVECLSPQSWSTGWGKREEPLSTPPPEQQASRSRLACIPCFAILLLAALCGGGITFGVFQAIQASPPYQDGLARAQADPRVREALGEPVQGKWWVGGTLQDKGNHGSATLQIPLEGPRGQATLDLAASKSQGTWTTSRAKITLESGETIDLMQPAPQTGAPGSGAPGKSGTR